MAGMSARTIAALAGVLATTAAIGCSSSDKPATSGTTAHAKSAHVTVSRKFSFCSQLPVTDGSLLEQSTVGTLAHVVVRLHNSGDKTKTVTIMPTRVYADGGEAFSPLKDTLEVKVPAHATRFAWHNYSVGPGHTLTGCRVDVDGKTTTLRVRA